MRYRTLARISFPSTLVGLALVGLGVLEPVTPGHTTPETAAPVAAAPEDLAQLARIEAHLARVASHLRQHRPAGLTPAQWAARQVTLEWLDDYRATGIFPHNHIQPGTRTPIFVDPHGTPCAVGYLLLRSGDDSLVEEIVRTDNLVRIPALASDTRLQDWLDSRGISLEEAAMIQPAYDWQPPDGGRHASDYVPVTVGLSMATAALISYNAVAGTESGTPLVDGLLVGAALGHLYLLADDDAGDHAASAGFNTLGLIAAVGTQVVRLMKGGDERGATQAGFATHVAPGPTGVEVGFTFFH